MDSKQFLKLNHRKVLSVCLVAVFLISLWGIPWKDGVMHQGGWATIRQMGEALLHPQIDAKILRIALFASWQTFAYALISISIAIMIAFFLGIFASGQFFRSKLLQLLARGILGFLRAIHELVWALIFVAAIGLHPMGAVFALAIPYGGALGKVFADLLQEVPQAKIRNVRAAGASSLQLLFYAYLPIVFPDMLSYIMYRLECAVRSSSVLSFVGLGGLGFQIQLNLQDLNYAQAWTFVYFLIFLVFAMDIWSRQVRKRLVNDEA